MEVAGLQVKIGASLQEFDKAMNSMAEKTKLAGEKIRQTGEGVNNYRTLLRQLEAETAAAKFGSPEFVEAAMKAGALKDKVNDARNATMMLATGSKLEAFKNVLGGVGDSLMNLDFEEAAEKAAILATVAKSMTFSEVLTGLGALKTAFISLGEALLANPFFLLAAAAIAIGAALYKLYSDVEDNKKAWEAASEALNEYKRGLQSAGDALYEAGLKMDVLNGKISDSEMKKKMIAQKFGKETERMYQELLEKKKKIDEDEDLNDQQKLHLKEQHQKAYETAYLKLLKAGKIEQEIVDREAAKRSGEIADKKYDELIKKQEKYTAKAIALSKEKTKKELEQAERETQDLFKTLPSGMPDEEPEVKTDDDLFEVQKAAYNKFWDDKEKNRQADLDAEKEFQDELKSIGVSGIQSLATGIGEMLAGQGNPLGNFMKTLGNAIRQLGQHLLQLAIAYTAASAAIPLFGKNAVAAGLAGGLMITLGTAMSATKMATGGIVSGNSIVNVGEYAGASHNPEVIAPLDKLKSMIGGGGKGNYEFTIKGDTLVAMLSKVNKNNAYTIGT